MNQRKRLEGKTAIITGASSGIGQATAELFARLGARLVLADINLEPLKDLADRLADHGSPAEYIQTDVAREDEVRAMVEFALQTCSTIDILCNNAGISGDMVAIDAQDAAVWQQVYAVNVLGAVHATKHVAPHMMGRGCGAIVNTASVAGIRSGAGGNAYSASKAALINFTQTAACEFGAFNVRVNAVCPGLIETGMTQLVFDFARQQGKGDRLGQRCELKRPGTPLEVAQAIAFLASDEAAYITGQALPVDGGISASLSLPGMKF